MFTEMISSEVARSKHNLLISKACLEAWEDELISLELPAYKFDCPGHCKDTLSRMCEIRRFKLRFWCIENRSAFPDFKFRSPVLRCTALVDRQNDCAYYWAESQTKNAKQQPPFQELSITFSRHRNHEIKWSLVQVTWNKPPLAIKFHKSICLLPS